MNSLRPHLGWADLKATVLDVLAAYRDVAAPAAVELATVRYINRVELPIGPGFALERYFAVLPGLPGGVPSDVLTFLIHTEVVYDNPSALLRFRFGTTQSTSDVAAFLLDYEHVAHAAELESLSSCLDAGHDRIEQAFYGSFTPMMHAEVFQEARA